MDTKTAVPVPVPPIDEQAIATIVSLTIMSAEQERQVIDGLAFIQSVKRGLEKARRELVDPLNARKDAVNAEFRKLLDPVEAAETRVKAELLRWRQAEAARVAAEQRRIAEDNARREVEAREAEAAARAKLEAAVRQEAPAMGFTPTETEELVDITVAKLPAAEPLRVVAPATPPPTRAGTLGAATTRKVWAFEVVDPARVPRAYLCVDTTAILAAVRAGVREIEGVRIFQREEIAGRSRF